jgi:hypothetical protein
MVAAGLMLAPEATFAVQATGGNLTNDSGRYRIHIFTNSATASNFVVSGAGNIEVLVVAGGGGGGNAIAGGGGAGGLIYSNSYPLGAGTTTVTVGFGGAGGATSINSPGSKGSNSVFGSLTAVGGGGGSGYNTMAAGSGGSGGGGMKNVSGGVYPGGAASPAGQGYAGGEAVAGGNYPGGGGGGAGSLGSNGIPTTTGGEGGVGLEYAQFATVGGDTNYPGWFAGGGGGGTYNGGTPGNGGKGGGGRGGTTTGANRGSPGQPNTGGGGGSGHHNVSNYGGGGMGGSGIVIVRYLSETNLSVQAQGASLLGSTQATLNGTVICTGGAENPQVFIGWGPTNAGTQAIGDWPHPLSLGTNWGAGDAFSTNVTGLLSGSNYTYRCYVSNSSGEAWSEALTFTTISQPEVTNSGATLIGSSSAWLNGAVTRTGGETPYVWFQVGLIGGSTTQTLDAGQQSGSCSVHATGLLVGSNYSYVVTASNSAGVSTSAVSTFATSTTDRQYRMKIAFTNPVQGTLTNFPVLVRLGSNTIPQFDYRQFYSPEDGADLRFTDATDAQSLNYEIEDWNTNGTSWVWVQVPTLAGTNDFIYAYWGQADAAPPCTTNGSTWTNGFRGVWHLNALHSIQADATSNGHPATAHGEVVTGAVGMVAGAVHLNGAVTTYLNVSHQLSIALTNNFTLEAWFKMDSYTTSFAGFLAKSPANYGSGWFLTYSASAAKFTSYIPTAGGYLPFDGSPDLVWHHLAFRFQNGIRHLFLDGVQQSGSLSGSITDSETDLLFGRIDDGHAYNLNGLLDEIRLSAVPRSSNWIWACWMNQRSNSTFCTYGIPTEGGRPNITHSNATDVTTESATLNGYLVSTGTAVTTAYVFWGTNDPGPVWGGWAKTNLFPSPATVGLLSTNVPLGLPLATFYCRFYATNALGDRWTDPAEIFGLPLVSSGDGVMQVGWFSATLQGVVQGNPPPFTYLYWGPVDQGTNLDLWRSQNGIQVEPGIDGRFTVSIDVPTGSTNYYRCFASNSYGQAWASATVAFTSAVAVVASVDSCVLENKPARSDFRIVFDGNSWIAGSGSTGGLTFPNQTATLLQNAGKTVSLLNYGVPGQTIIAMQSDATSQIDPNHTTYDFLIGLELVNQWGLTTSYTKEQLYSQYKEYFLDRKAAGFKYVFACTPHDQGYYGRTTGGDWATVRAYFIAQMNAEFPALGIGVIDCGSDPRLSDWTDTTYFTSDKIHLNNAGQAIQAQYAFNALMNYVGGAGLVVAWTATNSCAYHLQQTPTLTPAAWSNVPAYTNLIGMGTLAITNEVGSHSVMFYRLIAVETNR